jgi:serine/threonine protein kinase
MMNKEIEVKEIAKAVLEILKYLHELNPPVVHRDIKPSNILLGERSGNSDSAISRGGSWGQYRHRQSG